MKNRLLIGLILGGGLFASCSDDSFTPKPRAFPRVVYPNRVMEKTGAELPYFSFQKPTYATVRPDSFQHPESKLGMGDQIFSLDVPSLNARVYCTYYKINATNKLEKLHNDVFNLVSKHKVKANFVDEFPVRKPNKVSGFAYDIQGPAGCPFQFFLTDSSRHFLHGALYFNTQARPDSLAPVVDFMKTDLMHVINSFEWKN